MAYRTKESVLCHVESEHKYLESLTGLPFQHLLNVERILAALSRANVSFRDRIFTPMVTLWAFLSQVMSRADSSCRDAVSRVLADRTVRGETPCSTDTSSYCEGAGDCRRKSWPI